MKILIFILLNISLAQAGEFHLLAGAGINVTSLEPNKKSDYVGAGLNFKADIIYTFENRISLEYSSQVKFNKYSEVLIWDTLLTLGVRYQFKNSPYYTRVFFGRSPTVAFLDKTPEIANATGSSRIQFDGPVVGAGFGKLYKTKSETVWFIEYDVSYQKLEDQIGIRNEGEIPREVFNQRGNFDFRIISFYATIGFKLF